MSLPGNDSEAVSHTLSSAITQGKDGDITVLAIGPAPVSIVNEVTGKLRLL